MIENKKILIIGGTGSLGNALVKRYLTSNQLYLYSRDESKHWKMNIEYQKNKNLNFIIGDIRDKSKLEQTILRLNVNIIILAAAMKHIDKCEYESNESIETNLMGTKNCLNLIETYKKYLDNLECVLFVSTDKACSPVNIYGMCKAISESLMVEKSLYVPDIKFLTVRYGNVLNSNGSIIPMLHKIGKDTEIKEFVLTDERMTRFVMTLEQSVDLIEHAIIYSESGDIVIPKLISCNVKDLIEIFSEIYDKPIVNKGLRPGEKLLESLINETQSYRLIEGKDGYNYIKPSYKNLMLNNELKDYNSKINPLSKEELRTYLEKLGLIETKFLFKINECSETYN
jgi:UDP-N-acetylglucosamine 4,6-dehydratase